MTTTLEQLKAEQSNLAAKIAAFESQLEFEGKFPINISAPDLRPGEKFVATLITEDGKTRYHLILLPGDSDDASWKKQMSWAKKQGGDLPDRVEQAMLFKYMPDEFQKTAYWSNTAHATDSACAWCQGFDYGCQCSGYQGLELRARAVRRSFI